VSQAIIERLRDLNIDFLLSTEYGGEEEAEFVRRAWPVLLDVADAAVDARKALASWGGWVGPWGAHPAHGPMERLDEAFAKLEAAS
jgi:hypothetical protein